MLPEFSDPSVHSLFGFVVRPDLGGTVYDFVREISRDNEDSYFTRSASLDVNLKRLGQNSTPAEVLSILSNVFVLT